MRKIVLTTDHPCRQCVDLRATFGRGYKYAYDESYRAERPDIRAQERAWLTIMPCQFGHIYPHGDTTLAVSVDTRGTVAMRIAELPCTEVAQDGTDGLTATFDAADFDEIAQTIKPKRRRQLSEEQRKKAAETLAQYREQYYFQPGHTVVKRPETAPESPQTVPGV